jgi:hypothetical protein
LSNIHTHRGEERGCGLQADHRRLAEQIAVRRFERRSSGEPVRRKFTQCGYVAVNRPRCEPVPANVSVIGTASPRLGFPGVTSKVPAYLKVIGKVTSAGAGGE